MHNQPHDDWVGFTKRVVLAFAALSSAGLLFAGAASRLSLPALGIVLAAALLGLSLIRYACPGTSIERWSSPVLAVAAAAAIGGLVSRLSSPALLLGLWIAVASTAAYTTFCGRDLSFLGLGAASAGTSALAAVVLVVARAGGLGEALALWVAATLASAYLAYDLAMILKRRVRGEEMAAVGDLYRDLLNFITYPARIVLHWRRYRFEPSPGGRP